MKVSDILVAAVVIALAGAYTHASAQSPPARQIVEDLERQSWSAWQHHDGSFYAHFLSDDHIEIHTTGPATKAQVVAFVASGACTVTSFSLGDMTFAQLSGDAAVITYRAEQDTTCGGRHVVSPTWVTSGYVFRDGRWQNAVYVQTPTAGH